MGRLSLLACAIITVTLAGCGSSESDAVVGGSGATGGSGDSGSPGGTGGGSGSSASGGSGGAATGGTAGSGGAGATGGSSGAAGAAGAPSCNGTHPLVDGGARFCSTGDCYCSNPDACFSEATASACCTVAVTCEGSQNPVATIFHPSNGETRTAGVDIPFSGRANDPQDGALTGSSLVWTSDLTGALGTGETFNAPLTAGTHRITLTATDSDANTGTDSIELIVQ
jgi:hypothetical protein